MSSAVRRRLLINPSGAAFAGASAGGASAANATTREVRRSRLKPLPHNETEPSRVLRGTPQPLLLTLALLLTLSNSTAFAATFQAWVDQTRVDEHQSLNATFQFIGNPDNERPDFSPLEADFDIIRTRTSSEYRNINGVAEYRMNWMLSLSPKRRGELMIPALTFRRESTDAIPITVTAASRELADQLEASVFFETTLNIEEVYVQAEILYTVRLFYADNVQLYTDLPPAPDLANAIVQPLGSARPYNEVRGGRRYGVIEQKYALFPQQSGTLDVPPESITGSARIRIPGGGYRRRPVRERSPGHHITVLPKPPSYPRDATWLPASDLSISSSWNSEREFKVGVPLSRKIELSAVGLPASLLPALVPADLEGVKMYPDPPEKEETAEDSGIRSVRRESLALVPTRPGNLTLPQISVTWFDVDEGVVKVASLPAETYEVAPSDEIPVSLAMRPTQANAPNSAGDDVTGTSTGIDPWMIVTLICLIGWASTTAWLLNARRAQRPKAIQEPRDPERVAYMKLSRTCRANDAPKAHAALLDWANAFYGGSVEPATVALQQETGSDCMDDLLTRLYGRDAAPDAWRGEALLKWVESLRKSAHRKASQKKQSALPPLYPTSTT